MVTFALLLVATACTLHDKNAATLVTVKVQVTLPAEYGNAAYAGRTVTLGNATATTDANGVATFTGIIPDIYTITTSAELSGAEYSALTGNVVDSYQYYTISGTLSNQVIQNESTITLNTLSTKAQALLISKLYYAGTNDNAGKTYQAAKYIEIYNNSANSVKVDSLYIGVAETNGAREFDPYVDTEHIYLKQVFQIPAGSNKVLAPGGSLLLVNSATDHTASNDMDLTGADFEAYSTTYATTTEVPDLTFVYGTGSKPITYLTLLPGTNNAWVIFNYPAGETMELVYGPAAKDKNATAMLNYRYVKLPVSYVVDAVEALKKNNSATYDYTTTKRFPVAIDGGYVTVSATNGRSGEVVYRTVARTTADGRIVLTDTNNSANDFKVGVNTQTAKTKLGTVGEDYAIVTPRTYPQ